MKNKKFRNLKVDDTIVVYMPYSTRFTPTEGKITKVGREYVYAKCGDLASARRIFDNMAGKDIITWNAMITGLVISLYLFLNKFCHFAGFDCCLLLV